MRFWSASAREDDSFGREELAERLTGFLDRLPDGAVIAIDSPWGEGKTWFGKRWHAKLVAEKYRTTYIDCFQRDHVDDPFTMIAGDLVALSKTGKPAVRTKLIETGKKLGAVLLPAATKFAVKAVGHWAVGNADLGEDIAKAVEAMDESAAAGLEKLVAKRLEEFEADKRAIESFKAALSEFATEDEKPIVIFLDELDRCRPDFAVRTIERVKHFFDVPKVVFVLLLDRRQLVAAIEGMYGQRVDAEAYLGKFIQLMLSLPKRATLSLRGLDDNRHHCEQTMRRYGFKGSSGHADFVSLMGMLATYFRMSLRDVERAVALFSLAQPIHSSSAHVAWPISLKLARPDLFAQLLAGDREAHQEAGRLAAKFTRLTDEADVVMKFLAALHDLGLHGFVGKMSEDHEDLLSSLSQRGGAKEFFAWLLARVDLSVAA